MKKIRPTNGMVIREDVSFEPGIYHLPSGIVIDANAILVDGSGAHIIGSEAEGVGVAIHARSGVSIRNLTISNFRHGIAATDCADLTIEKNRISQTAEVAADTIFLDIWLPAKDANGAAILLDEVQNSIVVSNDLQHQQNGLMAYYCQHLTVRQNKAHYNSGFGFHLYETTDSLYEANGADYCCRFEPREGGPHAGHVGADAAGFLAVMNSSRNIFRGNTARLGGDGFFLAGLSPDGTKCGCNDNLFEGNDASLSPNIAFEATFCRGNVFRNNFADRCNYGFWLGFSWDTMIENNRMVMNRQAGIGVENGHGFRVSGNQFQANGHGILIWSHYVEAFYEAFPEGRTSHDWQIYQNTFTRNTKGIRIAADQDHGIRNLPESVCGKAELRPRNHAVHDNDIQDNRVGIELHCADNTTIERNILSRNVEANMRQEDCTDTVVRSNLGAAGAYL